MLQSSGSTPIYAGFYASHINSKVAQETNAHSGSVSVRWGSRRIRQRVAYESNSAGNLELYITRFKQRRSRQRLIRRRFRLTQITRNEVDDGSPMFFPDGERIAFVSARTDDLAEGQAERHQIYSINIDGTRRNDT